MTCSGTGNGSCASKDQCTPTTDLILTLVQSMLNRCSEYLDSRGGIHITNLCF